MGTLVLVTTKAIFSVPVVAMGQEVKENLLKKRHRWGKKLTGVITLSIQSEKKNLVTPPHDPKSSQEQTASMNSQVQSTLTFTEIQNI